MSNLYYYLNNQENDDNELSDELDTSSEDRMPKTYLMRWNPAISSFKLDEYRNAVVEYDGEFYMNWSIYEYEEAQEGDVYYMLRVGEGNTGIVWRGVFTSDTYLSHDWAGTSKKRYYVDITCEEAAHPESRPHMTTEELQEAIPDIDWTKGHSGELLTEEQAQKLEELWDRYNK